MLLNIHCDHQVYVNTLCSLDGQQSDLAAYFDPNKVLFLHVASSALLIITGCDIIIIVQPIHTSALDRV